MPGKGERSEKRRSQYEKYKQLLVEDSNARWPQLSYDEKKALGRVQDLVARMAQYTDPKNHQRLNKDQMKELVQDYQDTLHAMDDMKSFYNKEDFKKFRRLLGKDMKVFYDALRQSKDQEEFDIVDLYDVSRSMVVEVDPKTIETTGGNLSQRLHIKTKDENGNEIDGYFTVHDKPFDYEKELDTLSGSLMADDQMDKDFVRHLVEHSDDPAEQTALWKRREKVAGAQDKAPSMAIRYKTLAGYRKDVRKTIQQDIDTYAKLNGYAKGSKEYNALVHTADMLTRDTAATDKLIDATLRGNQLSIKYGICTGLGINMDSRIDMRNTAMSTYADVLGIGDSVATSRNMRVKIGDKTYKGTFMDTAKGQDLRKITPASDILDVAVSDLEHNAKLIKSIANLQVLDFLCGNTDRHGGNLSYITTKVIDENGKEVTVLEGVQGFDNDTSFMSRHGGLREKNMSAVPFSQMLIIPEDTAKAIINTDPVLLAGLLTGNDLTPAELGKTVNRIKNAQKEIKKGMAYYKRNPDAPLSTSHIKVVSDEDIAKLNYYDDLCNYQKYGLNKDDGIMNLFDRVRGEFITGKKNERLLNDYTFQIMEATDSLMHEARQTEESLVEDVKAMKNLAAQDKNDTQFEQFCQSMEKTVADVVTRSHNMLIATKVKDIFNPDIKKFLSDAEELTTKATAFTNEQQKKVDSLAADAPEREREIQKLDSAKAFLLKARTLKQKFDKVAEYEPKFQKLQERKAERLKECQKKNDEAAKKEAEKKQR